MKPVSRGLALEISARFATQVDWDQLDGEKLHAEVASLSTAEFKRRFTLFLSDGARFGSLKVACIQLDPAKFFGRGWTFWKGPKDGNGLDGEEERDKTAMALKEMDLEQSDYLTCLKKDESSITGEEKLIRLHHALNCTLYGVNQLMGLWQDYQQCQDKAGSKLEMLHQQRKDITFISFFGDTLRSPHGNRCVPCLCRRGGGSWDWDCGWLGDGWGARSVTVVSQQVSSV